MFVLIKANFVEWKIERDGIESNKYVREKVLNKEVEWPFHIITFHST